MIESSQDILSETNKYMLNILSMSLFPNYCTELMLNCFFLQSSYGYKSDICLNDNSTRANHASCSFLPPTITNPDNYTIQVEAQNADGIIKSDITHWSLDAISEYHFLFLYTLLLKDTSFFFLKETHKSRLKVQGYNTYVLRIYKGFGYA